MNDGSYCNIAMWESSCNGMLPPSFQCQRRNFPLGLFVIVTIIHIFLFVLLFITGILLHFLH